MHWPADLPFIMFQQIFHQKRAILHKPHRRNLLFFRRRLTGPDRTGLLGTLADLFSFSLFYQKQYRKRGLLRVRLVFCWWAWSCDAGTTSLGILRTQDYYYAMGGREEGNCDAAVLRQWLEVRATSESESGKKRINSQEEEEISNIWQSFNPPPPTTARQSFHPRTQLQSSCIIL